MERAPLKSNWNMQVVALSYLVGLLGSYTTTFLILMLEKAPSKAGRFAWLLTTCGIYGGGCIWSLHFTGMMALDIGVPVTYTPVMTLFSLIIAVAGATGAFFVKFRNIFVIAAADVESLEIGRAHV